VASGTLNNNDLVGGAGCVDVIGRPVTNIAALAFAMREGLIYVNLHTTDNPAGEVRGQLLESTDP
jgi:tRNA pseudouridine-54 N-methylase